jgi:hypothetical protein
MAYLASRPNRFIYVHTPKARIRINLIETVFSRMARTFLKGIRVVSREELKQRILQGVREMNLALHRHALEKIRSGVSHS